ncbi:HNH endonuclease [Pseudomonas viridiflava]|uniref:HNH endonuclease n=1 Tax=Pseudomonas viridiflava TaxID=33069 RepID=UPI0013CE61DC|nr:HNH endonuclease [Pseudomonas viridiflava]
MSQLKIKVYEEGDLTVWIPVSSRSPEKEARALLPFAGLKGLYKYGFKAASESSPYFKALASIQIAYLRKEKKTFRVKGGIETQRRDAWRHGQSSSPLLSPTLGWVEVPIKQLVDISQEELAFELESSGDRLVSSKRIQKDPEGSMFRQAVREERTFQLEFRARALDVWEAKCALSGATCVLEAAHIKGVAACKSELIAEAKDPFNSIILNVALHALLDAGLISFTDDGALLVSENINAHNRAVYGLEQPRKVPFHIKAQPYIQYHRKHVFMGNS